MKRSRREVIVTPNEYYSILNKHGHVTEWGKDWFSYDMKAKAKDMIKAKLPFKISQTRILHYTVVGSRALKTIEISVQEVYSTAPVQSMLRRKTLIPFYDLTVLGYPK